MTEILRTTQELQTPILEIWERSQYQCVKHKSLMNIFLKKNQMAESFDTALNDMFLHALRRYKNLDIMLFMNMDSEQTTEYYHNQLKDKYVRFGIKTKQVNKDLLFKILYQLHYDELQIYHKNQLEEFMQHQYRIYKDMKEGDEMMNMTILILCKKSKLSQYRTIRENTHCVYVPSNPLNKWILSTIFLNENTFEFLKHQEFKFYCKREYEMTRRWIQTYRQFYFRELSEVDQSQVLLFSSVLLYFIGHRDCNDIDIMAQHLSEEGRIRMLDLRERHTRVQEVEKRFAVQRKDPNYFMDVSIRNTEFYPKYWDMWLNEWSREYGAKYFEEILGNGDYHCYFLGVKMVTIECDLVRRRLRNRPNAVADLISFRKRYSGIMMDIPTVPEFYMKYVSLDDITEEEKDQYIQDGGVLNEKNREIEIQKSVNLERFMEDVHFALRERYHMTDLTIDDVKSELKIIHRVRTERSMTLRRRDENDITIGNMIKNIEIRETVEQVQEEQKKQVVEEDVKVKKTRKKILPKA